MRALRLLAAALLAAALLAAASFGCHPLTPPTEQADAPITEAKSSLARSTNPSADPAQVAALVEGNNAFALAMHQQLKAQPGNLMTSPYSISTALAMAWAGARGSTESQIAAALHFPLPQAGLHDAFNALDQEMLRDRSQADSPDSQRFRFQTANSAWTQRDYPFRQSYLDTLAVNYGAGLFLVDFLNAPEPARLAINDWVARRTEDRIKDLLSPGMVDQATRLVLTNAVYFKGTWDSQFDPQRTAPAPFQLPDGQSVQVATMHQTLSASGFSGPDYQAVEIGYRNSSYSMLVVAPTAGTFSSFEASFDSGKLAAIEASLEPREVTLSLPKFKFESKQRLKTPLVALGMRDAFDLISADLTGIAETHELYIGDVIHQTFVALDEQGTEAAAATAVIIAGSGLPPPALTVAIDRPFLFAIRERTTGQLAFLGRVVDPR